MLSRALFVLLAPVLAFAGGDADSKLVDKSSGLQVVLPDGWKRRADMESKQRPLVAVFAVDKGRHVQLVAEISSADNYDADAWVAQQKKNLGKLFDKLDNPLSIEERKVGGLDAVGFTLSGTKDDKAVRVRVFHVVRNGRFFQFTEASFAKAHDEAGAEAIDALWEGISFGEGDGSVTLQEGADAAPKEARVVEDESGNYKLKLPGNWELDRAPPTEGKAALRVRLLRRDSEGNVVALLRVVRFEGGRAEVFTEDTPGDIIDRYIGGRNLEGVFGENSTPHLTPDIDESVGLGGADKGAKWKISSITMEQKAKRKEAETRKRRGEKGVEIPKFKPSFARGRCAMISPYIYHAWAQIRADAAEDATLNAEITGIFESFEFLKSKSLPPAWSMGPIRPGNTVANTEFAKPRKEKLLHTATGRKVYKLGIEMTLPPGFRRLKKEEFGKLFKDASEISAIIVAQDENNNWATIRFQHFNAKKAGEERKNMPDKKGIYAGWKSEWESKARGSKVPTKPKKFSWGKAKGSGYKLLAGEVQGWPGTFSGVLVEKSGWMTIIRVETQGQDAKRFLKDLDAFFKKLKFNYKVK